MGRPTARPAGINRGGANAANRGGLNRGANRGFNRGGNRYGNRYGNRGWRGGYWNGGWYPGSWWLWGASAALLGGLWYYDGLSWDDWNDYIVDNPEAADYYYTNVVPAYNQYQADPSSVPVREAQVP